MGRMTSMAHPRAGQPALPEDLIDVDAVVSAYYDLTPDPTDPDLWAARAERLVSLGKLNDALMVLDQGSDTKAAGDALSQVSQVCIIDH